MATRRRAAPKAATPRIEKERAKFTQLLLANSNHFGTVLDTKLNAVKEMAFNTKYEEVRCVAYESDKQLLEAVVRIKLPYGYGGGPCFGGSTEYVRFYVAFGGGWVDAGVAAFNAHDIPNGNDCFGSPEKPLDYVVTLRYDPRRRPCDQPQLPNVRAILSWNLLPPPNQPNWVAPWGDREECHIQIRPRPKKAREWLDGILDQLDVKPDFEIVVPPELELQFPPPGPGPDPPPDFAWPTQPAGPPIAADPVPLVELAKLYGKQASSRSARVKAAAVGPERFLLPEIHPLIAGGAVQAEALALKAAEFKELGIDWANLAGLLADKDADVDYEEIECVGLDTNVDRLVATFRVKRPYGYGGPLCNVGTKEYVAFWADWDDTCDWEYLGTVPVSVHDFVPLPGGGVCYAAVLPVDLTTHRRPCNQPRVVRVRAVLSWSVPPSTTDPDKLEFYGNRLDTHVQIPPGPIVTGPSAVIGVIGGIPISKIDVGSGLTTPSAFFALNGIAPDSLGRPCPFAGRVVVQGPSFVGYKYRVSVRKLGDVACTPVTTTMTLVDWTGTVFTTQAADASGFYSFVPFTLNVVNALAWWDTTGGDLWELQLELADIASPPNVLDTFVHRVQLDNTSPNVDIQITGLGGNCGKFGIGTSMSGTFVARDTYLGSWAIGTSTFPGPVVPG